MKHVSAKLTILSLVAVFTWPGASRGQDKTKTHEVKPEKFEIQVELSGVFAAETTHEVSIEPKSWSQFKVVDAVPHGANVTAGQVLVRFDATDIDEAIEDMETDQQLAELTIMQEEEALPRLEKRLQFQYEAADRAHRIAREDFQRWQEIDRPLSLKTIEYNLKYYKNNLEYQEEELAQLEKMYEADDLTEETEEIILKRQRNAVEQARFSYELAENRHEEQLELQIPRIDASVKMALERAELDLAQAKAALEFSTDQRQFALQKSKHQRQRALEKHADMLADRELMAVKAPAAGVVYYGRATDGKWSGTQSLMESLKPGGSVSPKSVFMTIVEMRPLEVLTKVAEKNVVEVAEGASVEIIPAADEETEIAGKVATISALPVGEGSFPLKVAVTGDAPEWVVPGMTCKVKVTTYTKDDALTVPTAAVRTDEEDKEKKYVLVQVEGEDEPQRRDVKVGKTNDGKSEITEGISAGDLVVLGEPASDEDSAEKTSGDRSDEKKEEREAEAEETEKANSSDEPDDDTEDDTEDDSVGTSETPE